MTRWGEGEPRWLTKHEQSCWRAYIVGTRLLLDTLDRDLRREHGLSLAEYEILVHLSERPDWSMRMAVLADALCHSRSRTTHTVTRMQKQGWLERRATEEDGRGRVATMTDAGYKLLQTAAPMHVHGVNHYLIDQGSGDEISSMGSLFDKVSDLLLPGRPAVTDIRD